jgi:hypothetical protein
MYRTSSVMVLALVRPVSGSESPIVEMALETAGRHQLRGPTAIEIFGPSSHAGPRLPKSIDDQASVR